MRRTGIRWLLVFLGFFAYLLLLTWERVEWKERNGRIECLDRLLQQRRTDEALLLVQLEEETDFDAVQGIIADHDMMAAHLNHRVLMMTDPLPILGADGEGPIDYASRWFNRVFRGGVAQARPSSIGRTNVDSAE